MGKSAAFAAHIPRSRLIHVSAAERIHADDTTVPVLAKDKTRTGLWTYLRDDQPLGGARQRRPFFYSHDRGGEHPQRHLATYADLMQAMPRRG